LRVDGTVFVHALDDDLPALKGARPAAVGCTGPRVGLSSTAGNAANQLFGWRALLRPRQRRLVDGCFGGVRTTMASTPCSSRQS